MNALIISKTAYSNGWGSSKYKTVSGLTKEEKQAVLDGQTVIMENCPPSQNGTSGVTIRVVCHHGGKFYHRVPSDEVLAQYETM